MQYIERVLVGDVRDAGGVWSGVVVLGSPGWAVRLRKSGSRPRSRLRAATVFLVWAYSS